MKRDINVLSDKCILIRPLISLNFIEFVIIVLGTNNPGEELFQANGSTSDGNFATHVEYTDTEC